MIRIILILTFFFFCSLSFSQNNYELLFIEGDYEQIIEKSKKLVDTNDFYWNSLILDKNGKTLDAIEILKSGLEIFPENQKIEKLLVEYLYKTGQYTEVKPLVKKYLYNSEILVKYVNILGFEKKYLQAIDILIDKIKTDSLNLAYLRLLGDYYYQIDSLNCSIKVLEKQIKINPRDQKSLSKLSNLYIKTKRFEKAIQICDIVLQTDSLNLKFIRTKGIAGFKNKNYILANECFQTLLSKGDSGKFILKHLGVSEYRIGLFKEAREHLLLAYQVDSNDFETNYYLGNSFLNPQGLYYLNRADSLLQPNPLVLATICLDKQSIYRKMGNYYEAIKCYEKAYYYNPKPEYIFYIASLYQYRLDNKAKALEYYEHFIGLLAKEPALDQKLDENQLSISLKKSAETNINQLKEELFFKGELKQ